MSSSIEHAVTVRNFEEFRDDIRAFADEKYNFLIVVGNNGLSKTETVKSLVKNPLVIEGRPTPWKFYQLLYDNLHSTVILDDVATSFYRDSLSIAMLKKLTETRSTKTMRWQTNSAGDGKDYPSEFDTTSKVIILTNSWSSLNEDIRAIEGRAVTILFDPSPEAVHAEVGKWFHDQEVYNFVWENRGLITKPNMRLYIKIAQYKTAGRPWRKRGLEMMVGDARLMKIVDLLLDDSFGSNAERCEKFKQLGWGGRSTFYNLLKEFRFYSEVTASENPPLLCVEEETLKMNQH